MNHFSIPTEWSSFISYSFNRIYINPASGCTANCAYCYIFDYGHPHKPHLFDIAGADLKKWLQLQNWFRPGKEGTVISLGSSCDPFSQEVTKRTLDFVTELAQLGNPIQISTKYHVDNATAMRLGNAQTNPGQIVLYATITTFELWQKLEPAAHNPELRLEGLTNARQYGISTCLYIKPVLPGITDHEVHHFVQAIKNHKIPFCVIGIMYAGPQIENRLKKLGVMDIEFKKILTRRGGRQPPSKNSQGQKLALNVDVLEVIRRILLQLEQAGAQCVMNANCVVALSYDVLCPTGIWRYLPELCVGCRIKCEQKFTESPLTVRDHFPQDLNPLISGFPDTLSSSLNHLAVK